MVKSLGKRFGRDPVRTTKAEFKKLPLPAKLIVSAVVLGALGLTGAEVAQRLGSLDVGGILSNSATSGEGLAAKIKNGM